MQTAALVLAAILGAVGLAALVGTFFYARRQLRERVPGEQRRECNRLIAVGLLFWIAAALLVNGAAAEDVVARLFLLIAVLLFVALAAAVALWLRRSLAALRAQRRAKASS